MMVLGILWNFGFGWVSPRDSGTTTFVMAHPFRHLDGGVTAGAGRRSHLNSIRRRRV